jgi:hypothetical protein
MGNMAQIAQKRLFFNFSTVSGENQATDVYLDIPAALSAVNRKQYHQFTAKGDPLCYNVTVTAVRSTKLLNFATAPNTWTTANAARKTAVGWKKQLVKAGIRHSELPTYAKRFRCAYDVGAVSTTGNVQSILNQMIPDGSPAEDATYGTRLFTEYSAPDGGTISYNTSNEISLLPLSEVDGADAYKPLLIGDTSGDDFGMIYEYLLSRRNMREETDPSAEFPSFAGLMNTLYAVSETKADDVTKAAANYNTERPYSQTDASREVLGALVMADTTNNRESFAVPLGLLKLTGEFGISTNDAFIVDVTAVYEM